jgi:lipopolysaccharide/colanic/teichoic acid biosynthesis glycosyltransferase/glycosyltransferase involved in cell wall biosynthesis
MNAAPSATDRPASLADTLGKLHILMLDPVFGLSDRPGPTRSYDLARRFAEAGHQVSVLTTSAACASGNVDGITVVALDCGTSARFGYPPAPRIKAAFARGMAWRIWRFAEVDAVFTTDRPLSALPLLILFCFVRGIPLLMEVREGPPPRAGHGDTFVQRLTKWLARFCFQLAAYVARQIVVLSPDMMDVLTAKRLPAAKILLSAPGCDTTLFAAQPGSSTAALTAYPHLAQGRLVVYAGSMNTERNLDPILDLAAAAQAIARAGTAAEAAFAFCGDGPERGRLEARALQLGVLGKTVWFMDPLPRRDLPPLLSAAAAVIVDCGGVASLGLFFDALAASRPVVLAAPGWRRDLIEGRGAGLALPGADAPGAARELLDFLADGDGLRRANQQAASLAAGRFNLDRIAAKIRGLIEDSVAADPRHAVLRRRFLRTKRTIDFLVSLTALIVLSPVLLALAIAIQIKMGGPVVFTQMRPGLKGKQFRIYKFRTMTNARDASGALLSDGARLTPFGQFLRRTSLDEVPQLLNVLIGDMSLVGPRPLLPEYMPYYTSEQQRRHDVKPGVTGWAVVNGRNAVSWEEKFAMDVYYVDHLSLGLDLKILFKTVWIILTGKGVSSDGHATFERFDEIMARRQGAEDV